jgi:hypothetical protein
MRMLKSNLRYESVVHLPDCQLPISETSTQREKTRREQDRSPEDERWEQGKLSSVVLCGSGAESGHKKTDSAPRRAARQQQRQQWPKKRTEVEASDAG